MNGIKKGKMKSIRDAYVIVVGIILFRIKQDMSKLNYISKERNKYIIIVCYNIFSFILWFRPMEFILFSHDLLATFGGCLFYCCLGLVGGYFCLMGVLLYFIVLF